MATKEINKTQSSHFGVPLAVSIILLYTLYLAWQSAVIGFSNTDKTDQGLQYIFLFPVMLVSLFITLANLWNNGKYKLRLKDQLAQQAYKIRKILISANCILLLLHFAVLVITEADNSGHKPQIGIMMFFVDALLIAAYILFGINVLRKHKQSIAVIVITSAIFLSLVFLLDNLLFTQYIYTLFNN